MADSKNKKTLIVAIDARQARVGAVAAKKSLRSISTSLKGAGKQSQAFSNTMRESGKAMKMLLLPALATAFATTAMTIARFEEAMATLGAVTGEVNTQTGETTKAFERMEEVARELGATTRFSASNASAGMLELARAGFTAEEAMSAIKDTLDLATASGIGLGEASGYVANTVRQFGLEASEAVRVADAFVVVSNRSNTTVSELAEAMKMAGTVASAVGATIEETAAVIGVLGDRGVKATMAGTQLRGTLIALASPTSKAKDAIEELGLKTQDLDPAQNSLYDISVKLDGAFKKLGNRYDALGVASRIFGNRNASAALTLAGSTEKLKELTLEQEKSTKAHTDMANVMDDTLVGAWFNLKSAIEEAQLVMGEKGALSTMRSVVDTISEMVRILAGVEGAWEKATLPMKAFITGLEIIVARFVIVKSLGMISWLFGFTGAMLSSAVASGGLATAIRGIGTAIKANPIGLILTGIAIGYVAITNAIEDGNDALAKRLKLEEDLTDSSKLLFTNLKELQKLEKEANLVSTSGQNLMRERVELLQDEEQAIRDKIIALGDVAEKEATLIGLNKKMSDGGMAFRALGRLFHEERAEELREEIAQYYDLQSQIGDNIQQQEQLEQTMIQLGLAGADYHVILGKIAEMTKAYLTELTASETAVRKNIDAMQAEMAIMNVRGESLEHTIALQQALGIAQEEGIDITSKEFDALVKMIQEYAKAEEALQKYTEAQGKIADEKALSDMDKMIQKLVNMGMGLDEAKDKATQVRLAGEAMNESFASAFGDIIRGTESAKDALKNFFQFILDEILRLSVLNPMKELMGGMWGDFAGFFGNPDAGSGDDYNFMSDQSGNDWSPNARGNAYGGNGQIATFASGGIVSAPTLFNYAGGRGLMGEAGAEAIMPLKRDSKGNLGVASEGGQGRVVNVNMTVVAKDVNSFRRSQSQVMSDIQKASNRLT